MLLLFCVLLYVGCEITNIHFTFTQDGRPSGEAYVELKSEGDVHLALSKNQYHLGKRYIEGLLNGSVVMQIISSQFDSQVEVFF